MVVANAVAALAEIHEVGGSAAFHITSTSLFKLLRALNECTEWGQARRRPSMSAGPRLQFKWTECKGSKEQPTRLLSSVRMYFSAQVCQANRCCVVDGGRNGRAHCLRHNQ